MNRGRSGSGTRRFASLYLRLKPAPGGVDNEAVAGQIACGAHSFCIRSGRVELKKFCSIGAELGFGLCLEAFRRWLGTSEDHLCARFVRIPTCEQRDVRLLSRGVDVRHGVGQEPASPTSGPK